MNALRNNLVNRLNRFYTHQLLIEPSIEIRQAIRIQTQLGQHGCVQSLHMQRIVNGSGAKLDYHAIYARYNARGRGPSGGGPAAA